MEILIDTGLERTLDGLAGELAGQPAEIWLFEDGEARRAAERRLAGQGLSVRLRSAYKPLVHFFLEEADLAGAARVVVRYPVHPAASAQRFLLEAYPLVPMLAPLEVAFEPGETGLTYEVAIQRKDGGVTVNRVFAPNREHCDHLGETRLSPTGWLRTAAGDRRLATDYEAAFEAVMQAVRDRPWPAEPYFDRLEIAVAMPAADRPLPYGDEVVSLREALHEEIYFSLLEFFQRHSGRPVGDRGLRPGQIAPVIAASEGAWHCRVAMVPFAGSEDQAPGEACPPAEDGSDLAAASAPLAPARIAAELAALGGTPFEARSRCGRPVRGALFAGDRPGLLLSGGQHANETSGVIGALRAARRLKFASDRALALVPLENPDGYALNGRLCAVNPRHMNHASRYTALGDDLEYRTAEPLLEKAARLEGARLAGAVLHVNLHGYPAHEWTRPLTGYSPRGFEAWSLPKGFFLVLRHHPGGEEAARRFLAAVTAKLAAWPELVAFNRRQLAAYRAHAGEPPFEIVNDMPCQVSVRTEQIVPFTLVTEHPDETVYGEDFRFAHEVQMRTVLAAAEAMSLLGA